MESWPMPEWQTAMGMRRIKAEEIVEGRAECRLSDMVGRSRGLANMSREPKGQTKSMLGMTLSGRPSNSKPDPAEMTSRSELEMTNTVCSRRQHRLFELAVR